VEEVVGWFGCYGGWRRGDGTFARAGDSVVVREIIPQLALVGSPHTVRRELDRYEAAGVTHVQMRVRPADLPLPHVQRTIELVGSM
jgi:alkanesulfonate monooxygenase SsuD/methylene tetrahydromethanopterin reductase-like flavin-dependent oxidoreductase (luciferase family)